MGEGGAEGGVGVPPPPPSMQNPPGGGAGGGGGGGDILSAYYDYDYNDGNSIRGEEVGDSTIPRGGECTRTIPWLTTPPPTTSQDPWR